MWHYKELLDEVKNNFELSGSCNEGNDEWDPIVIEANITRDIGESWSEDIFRFYIEIYENDGECFSGIDVKDYVYKDLSFDNKFRDFQKRFKETQKYYELNKHLDRYMEKEEAIEIVKNIGKKMFDIITQYYEMWGIN